MFTTLSTALSALNANSTAVSVVGNDLANMNTTGYKTTEIAFQDLMAETMGGVNGFSLGMGTARPQTIRQFTQGSMQTGLGGLNAAIQGQGFFMVSDGKGSTLYTRDGTFTSGSNGYLVDANGLRVQGWTTGTNGQLNVNAATGDIPIPSGTLFPPVASSNVTLSMNLNSAAIAGTTTGVTMGTFSQPITVYDTLGTAHTLTANFVKAPTEAPAQVSGTDAVQIATGETATFTVSTAAGVQTPIVITGADGDTLTGQVTELNTQLQQYGITASLSGGSTGKLQFASANAFSVTGIASAAPNLVGSTAETTNNTGLNNQQLTSAAGTLSLVVAGVTVPVTLTGTGDVAAINTALANAGVKGVSAVADETSADPTTGIDLQGTVAFTATDTTTAGPALSLGTYTGMQTPTNPLNNTWNYTVTMPGTDLTSGKDATVASGVLTFDPKTGQLATPTIKNGIITLTTGSGTGVGEAGDLKDGAKMNDITWDLYDSAGNPLVTQVNQASAVSSNTADGSAAAQLTEVVMGDGGQLMAQFSNGKSVAIAQLSIANIPNPNSMLAVGNNDFETSSQTAAPIIGTSGTGGRGSVVGGALEQSTVDIATEFSQLITLQNAYQANSRVITTENQILQQTVSLVQP